MRTKGLDRLESALFPSPGGSAHKLLTLLLASRSDAISAWEAWRCRYKFGELDPESHRLLMMALPTLDRYKLEVPDRARLQGLARRTFCTNAVLWSAVSEMSELLGKAGIPVMLLSGLPLSVEVYEPGERYSIDVDVLVPHSAFEATQNVLARSTAFQRRHANRQANPDYDCGEEWRRQTARMDLHGRMCHEFATDGLLDGEVWERARRLQDAPNHITLREPLFVPSLEDSLIQLAMGQTRWDRQPHGLVDIARILDRFSVDLDWELLAKTAASRSVSLRLLTVLRYLANEFSSDVPINQLEAMVERAHPFEWSELRHIANGNRWTSLAWFWYIYCRNRGSAPTTPAEWLRFAPFVHMARGEPGVLDTIKGAARTLRRAATLSTS